MPIRGNVAKRDVLPDPMYNSKLVTRLINNIMYEKPPGQNCAAPLKREFSMQSKENCRRHPLWLSRRFDEAMRGNSRFKDDVFLRQHA